jgi:tyrosine-protein phosphatase SIW14
MKPVARLLALTLILASATRGACAANGVVNLGKVNDSLYRGGQPDLQGLRQLQALGVKSVINLRLTNDVWKAERAAVTAASMAYTNIPLDALSAPTDAQVASILAAISSLPKPVFVHCQYGSDRTGTIIACYRIREDRWPNSRALKEAEAYGISPSEVEMRLYILHYGK